MIMDLTAQIPDVTVGRAANAPHYEYMTTFGKRTAELPVDHERPARQTSRGGQLLLPRRDYPPVAAQLKSLLLILKYKVNNNHSQT